MPRYVSGAVVQDDLHRHPAVRAWRALGPEHRTPDSVHILKEYKIENHPGNSAAYRLTGVGHDGSSVIAKRCREDTALVERTVYEQILPQLPAPHLHYYGFLEETGDEFCWLFLEDAGGGTYSPEVADHRAAAARWLGLLHTAAQDVKAAARLPDRGPHHYLNHLRSASAVIQDSFANPALRADDREVLLGILAVYERLELNWQELDSLCYTMPSTLVQGDFTGKNIRLRTAPSEIQVLVFDWEAAGWGIPVADLAQSPCNSRSFSADPDIEAYWLAVQDQWPHLELNALGPLANVGRIFRHLAAINWVVDGLASDWVQRTMSYLAVYEAGLSPAVGADEWSR